jgi:hypothetical protein
MLLNPRTPSAQYRKEKSLVTARTLAHSLVIMPNELSHFLVKFRENFNSEMLLFYSEKEVG